MGDEHKQDSDQVSEGIGEPHEEIREVIRRGLKFSEELIAENEKLRFRVAKLEAEKGGSQSAFASELQQTLGELTRRVAELEGEKARLLSSFQEVETLNRDYQSRYAEIEEEHNNLANLYIASYQLHSTLEFREVLQIIAEIVINLVGVHRFALYLRDGESNRLVPVFAEGQLVADLEPIVMGTGEVGRKVEGTEVALYDDQASEVRAIVPLVTTEGTVGCIVVNELLVQKDVFSRVDHELFHLLGAHAATALITALLRHTAGATKLATALNAETMRRLVSGEEV